MPQKAEKFSWILKGKAVIWRKEKVIDSLPLLLYTTNREPINEKEGCG